MISNWHKKGLKPTKKHLTKEQKIYILEQAIFNDIEQRELAKQYNITPSTISRWKKKYWSKNGETFYDRRKNATTD